MKNKLFLRNEIGFQVRNPLQTIVTVIDYDHSLSWATRKRDNLIWRVKLRIAWFFRIPISIFISAGILFGIGVAFFMLKRFMFPVTAIVFAWTAFKILEIVVVILSDWCDPDNISFIHNGKRYI